MKRYLTSIVFVVVIGALSAYYLMSGGSLASIISEELNELTGRMPSEEPEPLSSKTKTTESAQKAQTYADGTYTGNVADAFYGNVQVQVVIKTGKIVDVLFLQHPSERDRSVIVNTRAMPLLTAQAIAAQSAKVDGVSGASATSGAFKQSLQSALEKATKA